MLTMFKIGRYPVTYVEGKFWKQEIRRWEKYCWKRITDQKLIIEIKKCYGLAMGKKRNNIKGIADTIMACHFHIASSDADQQQFVRQRK